MVRRFTHLATAILVLILLSGSASFAALSGAYTIDPAGSGSNNFTSVTAAVTALGTGVTGPVTFTIAPGTYTGRLYISAVSGASATNFIKFIGAGKDNTIITYAGTSTTSRATVVLYGADYITFENVSITNTGTSYALGVWLTNYADYNTFKNCNIIVPSQSSSYFTCILASAIESGMSYSYNANYSLFQDCYIAGGYYCIYWGGASNSSWTLGNKFINNEITQFYQYGMYMYYQKDMIIQYNKVWKLSNASGYGVFNYYGTGNIIDGNIINAGIYGLYNYYENYYNQSNKSYVSNNMIGNSTYASYHYIIYSYQNYNVNFLHNTLVVNHSSTTANYACLYLYYGYNSVVKNNVFASLNPAGGNLLYVYYGSNNNFDYNDYYYPNATVNKFNVAGTTYANLSAFKNASSYLTYPHDQNSWDNTDPKFASATDFHAVFSSGNQMEAPVVLPSGYHHDIDGDPRNTSGTSMIGADQQLDYDLDIISMQPVVAKMGNNTVKITLMYKGLKSMAAGNYDFYYNVDGGTWVKQTYTAASAIKGGTVFTITFSTAWNITVDKAYVLTAKIDPKISGDPDTKDEISQNVFVGMDGIYSIDASGSGDFKTFNLAVAALTARGVAGKVTFKVSPGTYSEKVLLKPVTGASKDYRIEFEGNDKTTTKLTFAGVSGSSISTVCLNGADFLTFRNLTVENTGTSGAVGFNFQNGADDNIIEDCIVTVPVGSTSYWCPITMTGSDMYVSSYSGLHGFNNVIKNNKLIGGYYGFYCYGSGSSGVQADWNNDLIGNTFTSQYYYGIYNYYTGGFKYMFNKITSMGTTSAYGMYMYYNNGDTVVSNIINAGTYGIYKYYNNYYDQSKSSVVANNMIYGFLNTSYHIGLYLYRGYNHMVYNNTFWVAGTSSSYSYATMYSYYSYYCQYMNNIFISSGYNYLITLYYPYNSQCDYNLYYYTPTAYGGNPNSYSKFWCVGSSFVDFASFRNYNPGTTYVGSHDQNSYSQVDPQVISSTDLHLYKGAAGYKGTFAAPLTIDVDNDMRCQLYTYLGADEPFHLAQQVDFIYEDTMCYLTPVTFYNTGIESEPHVNDWLINGVSKTSNFNLVNSFTTTGKTTVELRMQTCFSNDTIKRDIVIKSPTTVPISEFMISNNLLETDEVATLTDLSINCPVEWTWEITPATVFDPKTGFYEKSFDLETGSALTSQNPQIDFNYPGSYTVSLTTKNGIGLSAKEVKTAYVNVKFSELICGATNESSLAYGNLYDDGGQTGNYSKSMNCNYLIKACGDDVKIKFFEFDLAAKSFMKLYDGSTNKGIPMWDITKYPDGLTGNFNSPNFNPILYATKTGMIYIEFVSSTAVGTGFKLEWSAIGTGAYTKPIASFESPDTGCIVAPFYYENTSIADKDFSIFKWDFDGNGTTDSKDFEGVYNASFPGISAKYKTKLSVENCGGIDVFQKDIVLINPQSKPIVSLQGDILAPVIDQDIVTFSVIAAAGSCVDVFDWRISPSDYYFANGTTKNSRYPQVIFTKRDSFSISVYVGNSNTPYTAFTEKIKYIVPREYCIPVTMGVHSDVGLSHVKIGTIDNYSSIGVNGYNNFTNGMSTQLVVDQKAEITLERNTNYNNVSWSAWIDYNNNGTYEHPAELIFFRDNSDLKKFTTSFKVPANASLGASTMRIGVNQARHSVNPCGPFTYGEFEDYRVYLSPDNIAPVITLNGNNPAYVEIGYSYMDAGAVAIDNLQGNISNQITTFNAVNTSKEGVYVVTYDVCDSLNNCAEQGRRIVVVTKDNTPPVITLIGGDPIYANVNVPFKDVAYTAWDLVDGNITSSVIVSGNVDPYKIGEYELTYTVSDKMGLMDTKSRKVIVADVAPPDITLNGDAIVYHEIMVPYIDSGATYSDNYWPNSRISYQIDGYVDYTKIGDYTLTYSVTDASGNGPRNVYRHVIVYDSIVPTAVVNGADEIVIEVNEPWADPGITVTDNSVSGYTYNTSGTFYKNFTAVGGIVKPNLVGLFSIFYQVIDEAGNESELIARIVRVVDTKCPELVLKGDAYTSIEKWTNYVDAGYIVTDNYYQAGDITVDTFNNINRFEPGLYRVEYTATDPSNNNCMTIVRLVRVIYNKVGIDEGNLNGKLTVYPNPTTGKITIDVEMEQGSNVVISVINLLGEEVVKVNNGILKSNKFEVDLSDQSAGVYMVKVQTGSNTILERVILTK